MNPRTLPSRAIVIASALLATAALSAAAPARAGRAPGDELPDGPGKKILIRACTTCHDLDEVVKFKGYYNRAQWKDIVVTMKEYGAVVDAVEIDVLTDYLTMELGKREE